MYQDSKQKIKTVHELRLAEGDKDTMEAGGKPGQTHIADDNSATSLECAEL